VLGQPAGQRLAGGSAALEPGVGGGVLALVEHRLEVAVGQLVTELDPGGAEHAVRWPRVDEVRVFREVAPRVDVVVSGGHHVVVAVLTAQQLADPGGDRQPPGHGQRPALAEVALDVHHDQGPRPGHLVPLLSLLA
jgi:hypothetical protein